MEKLKYIIINQIRFDKRQTLSVVQSCVMFSPYFMKNNQPVINQNILAYE